MRIALVAILFTTACADTSELAALDRAQILAVRTEPANVAPGERARIDVLASDATGAVFEASPDTVTAGALAVERTPDGWYVTAGSSPAHPTITVTLALDGSELAAEKALVVGETVANPRIAAMQIDGTAGAALVAPAGTRPSLAVTSEGREPMRYAWYSSVGDLEYYRQPTAILDAATPATGTIVIVVRDGAGGVDWQLLPATIE